MNYAKDGEKRLLQEKNLHTMNIFISFLCTRNVSGLDSLQEKILQYLLEKIMSHKT